MLKILLTLQSRHLPFLRQKMQLLQTRSAVFPSSPPFFIAVVELAIVLKCESVPREEKEMDRCYETRIAMIKWPPPAVADERWG